MSGAALSEAPWFAVQPTVAATPPINAIIATLELQLVRLLRGAGWPGPAGGIGRPADLATVRVQVQPRRRVQPPPLIEPRPHIQPAPRIEPRQVVHPRPVEAPATAAPPPPTETPRPMGSVIEPPWRVLPWENPPQPAPKLKVVIHQPDVPRKGTVLDVFM